MSPCICKTLTKAHKKRRKKRGIIKIYMILYECKKDTYIVQTMYKKD